MKISINKAFKLWDKYYLPEKIREHTLNVIKVVVFMSEQYLKKGLITNQEQMRMIIAAVMHDIMKPICNSGDFEKVKEKYKYTEDQIRFWRKLKIKYPDLNHEEMIYLELKEDYPSIAKLIRPHGFWFDITEPNIPTKLLAYSDLRANGSKVLSIEKRILNLHLAYKHLYTTYEDWLKVVDQDGKLLKLETQLFSKIDAEPEDCNKLNNITIEELFKQHNIDKDQEIEG